MTNKTKKARKQSPHRRPHEPSIGRLPAPEVAECENHTSIPNHCHPKQPPPGTGKILSPDQPLPPQATPSRPSGALEHSEIPYRCHPKQPPPGTGKSYPLTNHCHLERSQIISPGMRHPANASQAQTRRRQMAKAKPNCHPRATNNHHHANRPRATICAPSFSRRTPDGNTINIYLIRNFRPSLSVVVRVILLSRQI